jgi:transglutaminase-like putative cysteine protease
MGGHTQAQRTCAAALWSFLLGLALAGAEPGSRSGLVPPQSIVVLLVGVPGDVESEANYRDQLQSWLDLVTTKGQAAGVFVLCDDPQSVTLPPKLEGINEAKEGEGGSSNQPPVIGDRSRVSLFKGDRSNFLGLGQKLVGGTNTLVVVAWGHGGRQGNLPVLHVRGPRITAADFKALASRPAAGESRWVLMFRGSGSFASELAGEGRQIISSEGETMFSDDPVGMPLLLKIAKAKPEIAFAGMAEELGKDTEAWYMDRHLARTEEPTLWVETDKPRRLAIPTAEEGALASVKPSEAKEAATNPLNVAESEAATPPSDLPEAWRELKRVEARKYPEADAVILRRRVSYTLGNSPAIATEQEAFIQVLTPEGKHYGDFDISYSPPYEDLSFSDCEVLRADGKLVRLDPDAIRDTHEQSVGDYQWGQRKFFSLPGVSPGAVLHVRYRTTWKTFPMPHVSLEIPIGQDLAAEAAAVQVSVPKETPFHFALEQVAAADPVIKQTTYGTTYSWSFENLPAQVHEVLVPPGLHSRLLISTYPDWATFAEWYGRISKLTDEVTPEIAAKAKELTREARDERAKVLALYNYVTRLRYVAVPLGVNSFRPHAAANVLQNEYGDCKDKANLFNALLHSVGIEARLVLVPRFSQAHEDLPGLAFNHAISQVNLGGKSVWVDTTDDVCRFGMLPPGDPGRKVLVIGGQTNVLTPMPSAKVSEHVLKVSGEVDCSGPIDALPVKLHATASGYPDYELRTAARESKGHAQTLPLLAAQFRPAAGSFALETQGATSVAALNEDFAWHATGTCVGLWSTAGGSRWLRAPFWLPKEWDLALHRRKAGLYLNQGYPLMLEEEFEFILPAETQPGVLPGVSENKSAPLRWRIEWAKIGNDKLSARMRAELAGGELSPAETPALQKQLRELLAALAGGASFAASREAK